MSFLWVSLGEFQNQFSEEKSHYTKVMCCKMPLLIVPELSPHVCLHERVMRQITQILFNERREDKTFKMHNINTSLKVFFNKEKIIALGKYNHNSSPLLLSYVLQSLYCTLVTQSLASWSIHSLQSFNFYPLLCSFALFSQNISFLTAGTWLDVCCIFRNKVGILSLMGLQLLFVCICLYSGNCLFSNSL